MQENHMPHFQKNNFIQLVNVIGPVPYHIFQSLESVVK